MADNTHDVLATWPPGSISHRELSDREFQEMVASIAEYMLYKNVGVVHIPRLDGPQVALELRVERDDA